MKRVLFFIINSFPKTIGISLCSTLLILNCSAQQAPGIEWQNTIGGTGIDWLYCIQETSDEGYILGGHSNSNISGDKTENCIGEIDYWIVKIDSYGNIQWQSTIGGSKTDKLISLEQTTDGGYILGGFSNSDISGDKTENNWDITNLSFDYWIIKIDSTGNIQWQKTIGGSSNDYLFSVKQVNDDGYILGGWSSSGISGNKTENSMGNIDYWIVKTDSTGNIQWQNTIGGNGDDWFYSVGQTTDGGYIISGMSDSYISGDKTEDNMDTVCNPICTYDYWIVKTDSNGNILWQNTIGGSNEDGTTSIHQTMDGGYIISGASRSNISNDKTENCIGGWDYWIIKADSVCNIQWQNTIGGIDGDYPNSICQTTDGGYLVGGWSRSNISGDKTEPNEDTICNPTCSDDYWIVKIDSNGNILWQNTIGGNSYDFLYSIKQTSNGGYILGGKSQSNISGDKTENNIGGEDYWIIKLFPDTITSTFSIHNSTFSISISPNPLTTQSKLTFNNPNKEKFLFTLYDITGQMVSPLERGQGCVISTTSNEITLTKGSKQAGVYLFSLKNSSTSALINGKIVIQ